MKTTLSEVETINLNIKKNLENILKSLNDFIEPNKIFDKYCKLQLEKENFEYFTSKDKSLDISYYVDKYKDLIELKKKQSNLFFKQCENKKLLNRVKDEQNEMNEFIKKIELTHNLRINSFKKS